MYVVACNSKKSATSPLEKLYESDKKPFYHGVASGDPLTDRIILWTRITLTDAPDTLICRWQISTSKNFEQVLQTGTVKTGAWKDFTVKEDVSGLQPGTAYFYRFIYESDTSVIGKTHTLSTSTDSLKLAVVSCSNWEFGYFNAYQSIANQDVDAVIHLGDYIYEYASGVYGDTTIGRINYPTHEIVSLQDYRNRYNQYHLDKGLQAARANHPFITIWDDHEVANNVYLDGAENHQETEGNFADRLRSAKQAYYEWIPIRESPQHYRHFEFAPLADLIMLDERLSGRTQPLANADSDKLLDSTHTMLGMEQLMWLRERLSSSKAHWKIIGNQVVFSQVDLSKVSPKSPVNMDAWDGYPYERRILVNDFIKNNLTNLVFVTGDTHSAWASTIKSGDKNLGVEIGTTSISSGNGDEYQPADSILQIEKRILSSNPQFEFYNNRDHGYTLLRIYPEKAIATWYKLVTLRNPDPSVSVEAVRIIESGTNRYK